MDQTSKVIPIGAAKGIPARRPIEEHDLLRLCDETILKSVIGEDERKKVRDAPMYKSLQRVFMVAYRMGEVNARPRPKMMLP